MNWPLAISRNRTALLAIVAAIAALIVSREGGAISRHIRNTALALLRPAESAARRLIVIAAFGLVATPRNSPAFAGAPGPRPAGVSFRPPAFRLFDPPKRFLFNPGARKSGIVPRIRTLWGAEPPASPPAALPTSSALTDDARLDRRLAALSRALNDLPRQARRLVRWRARGDAGRSSAGKSLGPQRPLRIGRPPGWRARPDRDVDLVLRECHLLALDALRADTS
jgi:hypothetical protein